VKSSLLLHPPAPARCQQSCRHSHRGSHVPATGQGRALQHSQDPKGHGRRWLTTRRTGVAFCWWLLIWPASTRTFSPFSFCHFPTRSWARSLIHSPAPSPHCETQPLLLHPGRHGCCEDEAHKYLRGSSDTRVKVTKAAIRRGTKPCWAACPCLTAPGAAPGTAHPRGTLLH